MSRILRTSLLGIVGLLAVVVLAALMMVIFSDQSKQIVDLSSEPTPTPVADARPNPEPISGRFDSPLPTPLPTRVRPPGPIIRTPPPTATFVPVPTWPPTPIVTPIATAVPPIVLGTPSDVSEDSSYTVVVREANGLHIFESDADGQDDAQGDAQGELIDITELTQSQRFLINRSHLGPYNAVWAAASPDGNQLALVLTDVEDGTMRPKEYRPSHPYEIHLFDMDSGELRLLVEQGIIPVWSPDGNRLAYRHSDTQNLWIVDVETGEKRELFDVDFYETGFGVGNYAWSPDGKRIAVIKSWGSNVSAGGIWLIDTLNGNGMEIVPMEFNAGSPTWPHKNSIIFFSNQGDRLVRTVMTNLWAINIETGELHQLTKDMTVYHEPSYSRNHDWFVFAGMHHLESEFPSLDIWLMASDGTQIQRLNYDVDSELDALLVPDDTRIVFNRLGNGLWELDLRTGDIHQLYVYDAPQNSFIILNDRSWNILNLRS